MTHAVAVLTRESIDEILAQGGTGHWVTSPERAATYPYVVCVRNRNHPSSPDDAPHHCAVLIGRVAGAREVGKTEHGQPRVFIRMSAYALINVPGAWGKTRNPVWYTTLEDLGVDLRDLAFEPMPEAAPSDDRVQPRQSEDRRSRFTWEPDDLVPVINDPSEAPSKPGTPAATPEGFAP